MNLLVELELIPSDYCCPFWCDNQAVVSTIKKPPEDWNRNHLNTKYFKCSEFVCAKRFFPQHIEGTHNPADLFTKGLDVATFVKHKSTLLSSSLSRELFNLFRLGYLAWHFCYQKYMTLNAYLRHSFS